LWSKVIAPLVASLTGKDLLVWPPYKDIVQDLPKIGLALFPTFHTVSTTRKLGFNFIIITIWDFIFVYQKYLALQWCSFFLCCPLLLLFRPWTSLSSFQVAVNQIQAVKKEEEILANVVKEKRKLKTKRTLGLLALFSFLGSSSFLRSSSESVSDESLRTSNPNSPAGAALPEKEIAKTSTRGGAGSSGSVTLQTRQKKRKKTP
jgi:hypothetical protein